jgi:hypothetical protein
MNKARPTMSGSLIKHRAYLTYITYNKNVNNNNNNNNNNNSNNINSSSSSSNNNKKKKRKKLMRTLRWEINVRIKQ